MKNIPARIKRFFSYFKNSDITFLNPCKITKIDFKEWMLLPYVEDENKSSRDNIDFFWLTTFTILLFWGLILIFKYPPKEKNDFINVLIMILFNIMIVIVSIKKIWGKKNDMVV